MIVLNDTNKISSNSAVTIGKFDGIHKGHSLLINEAVSSKDLASVVLIINSGEKTDKLYTADENMQLLQNMNVDYLDILELDKKTASMQKDIFIRMLMQKYNMKKLIVGNDFRFGNKAEGNVEYLKKASVEFGFEFKVMEDVEFKNEKISSSRIKTELKNGNTEDCTEMLGRYYAFEGVVEKGKQLGRTISFPTVNITVEKFAPKFGVYASYVEYNGKKYMGITNVGVRPTVENSTKTNVETFIFDFDKDIYGENIKVELIGFIREECKFDSIETLKNTIGKDCKTVKEYFEKRCLQTL